MRHIDVAAAATSNAGNKGISVLVARSGRRCYAPYCSLIAHHRPASPLLLHARSSLERRHDARRIGGFAGERGVGRRRHAHDSHRPRAARAARIKINKHNDYIGAGWSAAAAVRCMVATIKSGRQHRRRRRAGARSARSAAGIHGARRVLCRPRAALVRVTASPPRRGGAEDADGADDAAAMHAAAQPACAHGQARPDFL